MATYISLLKFTEKGAREISQSTQRAEAFRQAAEKAGMKIEGQYWTTGAYDGVLILSGDNPDKLLHTLTELVGNGNVTTQTMQAFNAQEFAKILGG